MKNKDRTEQKKPHPLRRADDRLREQAEKLLAGKLGNLDEFSTTDIRNLIHELQVHQIELEMQNEELRRAQLELEESRSRYSDLYEFAPVGYFTLDEKGLILEVNLTGAALLGIEKRYLVNQPFSLYVTKESREVFYFYGKRLLETAASQTCELRMFRKDGTTFYAQLEGVAVFDSDGNFSHLRVAALDITGRKRMEEALKESEKQHRNLFNNVPTGAYRTTPDGRILMANPALVGMLGYSSLEELTSRNLEVEGMEAEYPRSQFKELLEREGEVRGLEYAWKRHDGTRVYIRENARAIRGEDGTVLYYEGTVEDITERKRADEALRESLAQLSKKNRYETIIGTVTRSVHQSINLQEVLDNAVETMSKNIEGVNNVFISLVEGEEAVLKAYRGYPEWFIDRVKRIPYPKGATWKAIIGGKPLYCADTDNDKTIGPAGKEVGTKSYVSMPIRQGGKAVGVININSLKKNAFDEEEELELLEIVARQIEIAINNARQAELLHRAKEELELRVRERTQELYEINEELRKEIAWRKRAEKALIKRTEQIFYYQTALLELAKMDNSDLDSALKRINEADSKTLRVERVSVWLFSEDRSEIICKNLYKMSENSHENGSRLQAEQYPVYFQALEESRVIAAGDARTDPRTSEFTERYLKSFGITSMMDVPVRLHGKVVGIVCHEHTGLRREWSPEEQDFAVSIADMVSLTLEASERRRAEEQIKASLKEKEVLLKEIHHRVKNNLQIISSLLNLQSEYVKEKQTIEMFNETQNRVQSMALIHEILYQSEDLSEINFGEYIENLTTNLFYSYAVKSKDIKLEINVDGASLGVDKAISCGLIINELVSNSLKHAFPKRKKGEIRIELVPYNDTGDLPPTNSSGGRLCILIISDNGVGFPKDLDFRNTESIGLQLVITLVKKLKGTIELDMSSGTEFRIMFSQ